jgi:hypothetical protein
VAGRGSFELSIEVLQAFEFKIFKVKMILCGGAFSESPATDCVCHADFPGLAL